MTPIDSDTRARIIDEICGRLVAGESVAAIFRDPGDGWPHFTTFWRWLRQDEALSAQVAEAEIAGCKALEDRLLDVTREVRVGQIVTETPKGREVKYVDMVDRSRLEGDGIKWVLSKRYPKRYGDRTTLAGDADNPLYIADVSGAKDALLGRLGAPTATAGARKVGSGTDE